MRGQAAPWSLLAVLVFAGCVGIAQSKADGTESAVEPVEPEDVDPNASSGILQGTVASDEAVPIAGASVALRDTAFMGVTDASGLFVITDVPPGKYVLDVARLGYEAQARSVEVQAGQLTEVTIVLVAIEISDEGYIEIIHFTGFFECALGTSFWISSCSYPYTAVYLTLHDRGVNGSNYGLPPDIQKNIHRFNFTVKPGITDFVGEMEWKAASAAATRMLLMYMCGDYDPIPDECKERHRYGRSNGFSGTSPIRAQFDPKQEFKKGCPNSKFCLKEGHPIWVMAYAGLPFGQNQVAFQQKFEIWNSLFFNQEAPEDYTLIGDK